jgi:hypothetical protein
LTDITFAIAINWNWWVLGISFQQITPGNWGVNVHVGPLLFAVFVW